MLTERQLLIFRAIIDHFTWTIQPVGSKNLLKEKGLPYSSATIRNEMGSSKNTALLKRRILRRDEFHQRKDIASMSITYSSQKAR